MTIFEEVAKDFIDSRREMLGSEKVDKEHESFVLKFIPCSSSEAWGFDIINTFAIVLKGLLSTKDEAGLVNILQTDSPGGGDKVFDHNFFLFSIPKLLWMSTLGNQAISVFSFAGASTSGYSGSGPEVHAEINRVIEENADEVALRRVKITGVEHKELQEMFKRYGPILISMYPNQLNPIDER